MFRDRRRGAGNAPGERKIALSRVQRGGSEGADSLFLQLFYNVFKMSVYPALWLTESELGGVHGWSGVGLKLRASISFVFHRHF